MIRKTIDAKPKLDARLRDLHRVLGDLLTLHSELLDVIQRKLVSMRQSDVARMQLCADQERALVAGIGEREGFRKQLSALIGRELGLGEKESRGLTIRGLLDLLPEEAHAKLWAAATQLSNKMIEIGKVNAVVCGFANAMLEHFRCLFSSMTAGLNESDVYARTGKTRAGAQARLMDARG